MREELDRIFEKYPDAVGAVVEFEEEEKMRLGEDYEKLYIWG